MTLMKTQDNPAYHVRALTSTGARPASLTVAQNREPDSPANTRGICNTRYFFPAARSSATGTITPT